MNKFKKGILTFGGLVAVAAPIATSIAATNTVTKTPKQIADEAKAEADFQAAKKAFEADNVKGDTRDYFVFDNAKYPWIDQNKDGILTQKDVIFTVGEAKKKEQARLGEADMNVRWNTDVVLKNVSFPKYIHTLGKAWDYNDDIDSFDKAIFPGWRVIGGFKIPINIKTINGNAFYYSIFVFYKKDYVEIENEEVLIFVGGIEAYKSPDVLKSEGPSDDPSSNDWTQLALKIIPKPIIIKAKVDSIWKIIAISVSITLGVVLLGSSMYWFDRDKTK